MRCCFVAVQFPPIGVPLMYYFLLHRLKNLIDLGQKRLSFELGEEAGLQAALVERERQEEENEGLQGVLFLCGSFEPIFWWFEILDIIRRTTIADGCLGNKPNVYIYDFPSFTLQKIPRNGTERGYKSSRFTADGEMLSTVGGQPYKRLG